MWALPLVLLLTASGCAGTGGRSTDLGPPPSRSKGIVIGAFNFSESRVLAEIYRQALNARGRDAEVIDRVASREIMEPALEQGEVDLVPEYLGTALRFIEPDGVTLSSARKAHRELIAAFADRDVEVLDFAPGQNRNEVVVTSETAERYGLETISDLRPVAGDLVLGGPPECPSRPFCLPGLEGTYGLRFSAFVPLDSGGPATVAALDGSEVDVAILFTTNPAIATHDFVLLEDDEHLQPSENIVPVIRQDVLAGDGGDITNTIDAVTGLLTDLDLRELNRQAEVLDRSPSVVAREWLVRAGLI